MGADPNPTDQGCDFAEMAKPAPEHALLEPFVGTFKSKVTIWFQPGAEPMTSTGTMTNRLILGGKFIEHDYTDDPGMFQGKGYWGYNTFDKRWEGVWIDSMASLMHIQSGERDAGAKRWEMTGELTDPMSGAKLIKRDVITLIDNDHHTMESFHSMKGSGKEHRSMLIEYTRA